VIQKLSWFALCVLLVLASAVYAQSPSRQGLPHARVNCISESYVTATADPEQALPLQVAARLACNDVVTIVSDPEGYTVRVTTADGRVGYVTRHELVILPATVSASSPAAKRAPQASPAAHSTSAPEQRGPSKPRVFITDSESWTDGRGFDPTGDVPGYNPELGDIYEDFTTGCPALAFVQDKSDADYAIVFERAAKKGLKGLGGLVKVNQFTVFSRKGETIASESSRSQDTAVKLACDAITARSTQSSSSAAR
jgi:hypothetical protein